MNGEAVVRLVAEGAPELTHYGYILASAYGSSLSQDFLLLLHQLDIPLQPKPFNLDELLSIAEAVAARLPAHPDASIQSIQPGPQSD
jgi:hypothetical protein